MIEQSLKKLLIDTAVDPKATWAIVRDGVVAEFSIVKGDAHKHAVIGNELFVNTTLASLKITFDDCIKPIVAETAAYGCSPWVQNVYLCIPENVARMSQRKQLTHVMQHNQGGEIWDLGVGYDTIDACIIVRDAQLHQKLKQKEGYYIIDDSKLLKEIVKSSPVRLFKTKFAEIMVKQKIPINGEHSEGPHTHLLPSIIHNLRYPLPIESGVCPVIQVDPFGSVIDGNGKYHEWKGFEADEFQSLLKMHGQNEYLKTKDMMRHKIIQLLEDGESLQISNMYSCSDKQNQDMMRVIMAQIACDKHLNASIRKGSLNILNDLKTINSNALKKWSRMMSPILIK